MLNAKLVLCFEKNEKVIGGHMWETGTHFQVSTLPQVE